MCSLLPYGTSICCFASMHMAQNLFILSIVHVYTFSAPSCTAHCALYLARDHAP